jgi:hypothetical protein
MPGYVAAIAAAEVHRCVVGYKDHIALLQKDNLLEIGRRSSITCKGMKRRVHLQGRRS